MCVWEGLIANETGLAGCRIFVEGSEKTKGCLIRGLEEESGWIRNTNPFVTVVEAPLLGVNCTHVLLVIRVHPWQATKSNSGLSKRVFTDTS